MGDRLGVKYAPKVPPAAAIGKALTYLHHEWPKLVRYLDDGRLEIDTNKAENALRPFVLGRNYPPLSVMEGRGIGPAGNCYFPAVASHPPH